MLHIQCSNRILFLERYVGVGATVEQFVEIFNSARIAVVFRDEVERQNQVLVQRVCAEVAEARIRYDDRWYGLKHLAVVDAGLVGDIEAQEAMLRDAIASGDDNEIRIHGEAMVRGWQAANKRMEDNEIAKALRALPGAKVIAIRPKDEK